MSRIWFGLIRGAVGNRKAGVLGEAGIYTRVGAHDKGGAAAVPHGTVVHAGIAQSRVH